MVKSLALAAQTRREYVDNRLSLQFYYRNAANLLKQATVHKDEGDIINSYILLLQYKSLVLDTIPDHREYRNTSPWDRAELKKKLGVVQEELKALEPDVQLELDRRKKVPPLPPPSASEDVWAEFTSNWPGGSQKFVSAEQGLQKERARFRPVDYRPPSPEPGDYRAPPAPRRPVDDEFRNLSVHAPRLRDDAHSRQSSVFEPSLSRVHNSVSSRIQHPVSIEVSPPIHYTTSYDRPRHAYSQQQFATTSSRIGGPVADYRLRSEADSGPSSRVYVLADGVDVGPAIKLSRRPDRPPPFPPRFWPDADLGHSGRELPPGSGRELSAASRAVAHPDVHTARVGPEKFERAPAPRLVRQPDPPPTRAPVQTVESLEHHDFHKPHAALEQAPRPRSSGSRLETSQPSKDKSSQERRILHLHVSIGMMEEFLALSRVNTKQNLETCAVLGGFLRKSEFYVSALIIPKQECTSDSCQTINEEEIFEVQDKRGLFQLGWIHTHPTQTCFMSSIDLHTHYSYQIMLSEAIAIVMAPTDSQRHDDFSSDSRSDDLRRDATASVFSLQPHERATISPYDPKYGIFRLSDTGGIKSISQCQERGFHPHAEPADGSPIYEHCGHVYISPKLKFDVIDLRET